MEILGIKRGRARVSLDTDVILVSSNKTLGDKTIDLEQLRHSYLENEFNLRMTTVINNYSSLTALPASFHPPNLSETLEKAAKMFMVSNIELLAICYYLDNLDQNTAKRLKDNLVYMVTFIAKKRLIDDIQLLDALRLLARQELDYFEEGLLELNKIQDPSIRDLINYHKKLYKVQGASSYNSLVDHAIREPIEDLVPASKLAQSDPKVKPLKLKRLLPLRRPDFYNETTSSSDSVRENLEILGSLLNETYEISGFLNENIDIDSLLDA